MSKNQKSISAISWILVAVCMSIIFALSHQPSTESAELSMAVMGFVGKIFTAFVEFVGHDVFRSIAHGLEYCGLGLLLFNAMYQTTKQPKILFPFLISVFYSVTDEIHQIFVEGRAFQFIDIAVDTLGSAVGVAAGYVIYKIICHFRGKKLEEKR